MVNALIIGLIVIFVLVVLLFFYNSVNSERISTLEKKSKTDTDTHQTLSNRITKLKKDVDLGFEKSNKLVENRFDQIQGIMNKINSFYENEDTIINNLRVKNREADDKIFKIGKEVVEIKNIVSNINEDRNLSDVIILLKEIVDNKIENENQ